MAIRSFLALVIAAPIVMSITPAATAANRKCMGERATIVGTNGADTLIGTRRADVIVGRGGDDEIYGKGRADLICGGGGSDYLDGGDKRDRIAGQAGDDALVGRRGNDVLAGADGFDALFGMAGGDRYVGGGGADTAAFLAAKESVVVDLFAGAAEGEGADTLQGIEGAAGSAHDDWLYGDGGQNFFWGLAGDDYLYGAGGDDFVLFGFSGAGVSASLADESATGEGSDELVSIEDLLGSDHDDTLIGNAGPNFLIGGEGQDTIDGRGGADFCLGETRLNCPSLPDDPPEGPPSGDDPPPPPSGASRASAVPTMPNRAERKGAFSRLGASGMLDSARMATALSTTEPASGYFDCIRNVAYPPLLSYEGWVSWKVWWLFYSPATGYYWVDSGWTLPYWQWTGTMPPRQAPGDQFLLQGYVAAYYQLYNWHRGLYGGYYAPGAALDVFGQVHVQSSPWCGAFGLVA